MNQEKIGKFIQEKRKEKNMTQQELAEKLRVTNRSISKWETGKSLPDYSIVNDICKELDITINELFQGKDIDEESYVKEQKKKQKKNKIKKIIITIILILIIYIIYKWFILIYYGTRVVSDSEKNREFPYNGKISTMNVKKNNLQNEEYNDIKFYVPKEFKHITDKSESSLVSDRCEVYIKDNKSNNYFSAYIMVCNSNNTDLANLETYGIESTLFPFLDPYSLYKKYNIKDQFDLYKYYEKNYKNKENIFTKTSKIQMNYIARQYSTMLATNDYFYYLEGDLRGILQVNTKNHYQMFFKSKDNTYSMSFSNNKEEYFNEDNVKKLISSIDTQ